MTEWVLTVSQLNEYVGRSLASDPMLRSILLQGEIGAFKKHVSGHWYFTLKDENSRINCVMYRQNTIHVRELPSEGDRVVLRGSAGLYTAGGAYQFYATSLEKNGQGELYLEFERRKERLSKEGLFDEAKKRPLPLFPRVIAVVTSKTGAVIHDINTVASRRDPSVQILIRPSLVQGSGAAEDIAAGIRECCSLSPDVLIVGRGGGSLEDLWPFNEEIVVRAIASSTVPVISAVGHEIDFTLADFAADIRAATPSAAAEIAIPERNALREQVQEFRNQLGSNAQKALLTCRQAVLGLEKRLHLQQPGLKLSRIKQRSTELTASMQQTAERYLLQRKEAVAVLAQRTASLSPSQVLARGYSVIMDGHKPVVSIRDLGEEADICFIDGTAHVKIMKRKEGNAFERFADREPGVV